MNGQIPFTRKLFPTTNLRKKYVQTVGVPKFKKNRINFSEQIWEKMTDDIVAHMQLWCQNCERCACNCDGVDFPTFYDPETEEICVVVPEAKNGEKYRVWIGVYSTKYNNLALKICCDGKTDNGINYGDSSCFVCEIGNQFIAIGNANIANNGEDINENMVLGEIQLEVGLWKEKKRKRRANVDVEPEIVTVLSETASFVTEETAEKKVGVQIVSGGTIPIPITDSLEDFTFTSIEKFPMYYATAKNWYLRQKLPWYLEHLVEQNIVKEDAVPNREDLSHEQLRAEEEQLLAEEAILLKEIEELQRKRDLAVAMANKKDVSSRSSKKDAKVLYITSRKRIAHSSDDELSSSVQTVSEEIESDSCEHVAKKNRNNERIENKT